MEFCSWLYIIAYVIYLCIIITKKKTICKLRQTHQKQRLNLKKLGNITSVTFQAFHGMQLFNFSISCNLRNKSRNLCFIPILQEKCQILWFTLSLSSGSFSKCQTISDPCHLKRDTPSAFDLKTIQTKNTTCHIMMSLKPTKAQIW